jgi:hypothetical protein
MIFSGSMREMKQQLQRDDFCLELDGDPEDIRQLAEQAGQVQGISVRPHEQNTVVVEVAEGHSRAGVMAEVLQLVDSSKLALQAIRSTQNETEYAYLQLLQEDSDHGFRRFDLQSPREEHAAAGDSLS